LISSVTAASIAAGSEKIAALTIWKFFCAMNVKTGIVGAILIASVVAPLIFERQTQARSRAQDEALRRQNTEVQGLQKVNEDLLARVAATQQNSNAWIGDAELLRLRGEVAKLRNQTRGAAQPNRAATSSREEALAALERLYGGEVAKLKQWLDATPAQRIPEMDFLSEHKWSQLLKQPLGESAGAYERAASTVRFEAENEFANTMLRPALQNYAEANGGQFPKDLAALKPYFKTPVADGVLNRWEILPGNNFQLVEDEDWVVTQKAPVNKELDRRIFCGLRAVPQIGQWGVGPK